MYSKCVTQQQQKDIHVGPHYGREASEILVIIVQNSKFLNLRGLRDKTKKTTKNQNPTTTKKPDYAKNLPKFPGGNK